MGNQIHCHTEALTKSEVSQNKISKAIKNRDISVSYRNLNMTKLV